MHTAQCTMHTFVCTTTSNTRLCMNSDNSKMVRTWMHQFQCSFVARCVDKYQFGVCFQVSTPEWLNPYKCKLQFEHLFVLTLDSSPHRFWNAFAEYVLEYACDFFCRLHSMLLFAFVHNQLYNVQNTLVWTRYNGRMNSSPI